MATKRSHRRLPLVPSCRSQLGVVAFLACCGLCTFTCFVRSRERKGVPIFRSMAEPVAEPAANQVVEPEDVHVDASARAAAAREVEGNGI